MDLLNLIEQAKHNGDWTLTHKLIDVHCATLHAQAEVERQAQALVELTREVVASPEPVAPVETVAAPAEPVEVILPTSQAEPATTDTSVAPQA